MTLFTTIEKFVRAAIKNGMMNCGNASYSVACNNASVAPIKPAPSRRTIRRRLQANGLHGRRPVRKPFISEKNRSARVAWARAHLNWVRAEWAKHIWSDESKFNMFGSDGNTWIRRPVGARYLPKYQLPTVKHGGGSCMVWVCFSAGSMGPLRRIQGIMDRFYRIMIRSTHLSICATGSIVVGWTFWIGPASPRLESDRALVGATGTSS
uniref:HTH_Tnp_Tc3_2 domain-containing protein n=1 Tax=Caenorhabditis japonica TaxID=281687 RepID=A0A8R1DNG3_CAEJA